MQVNKIINISKIENLPRLLIINNSEKKDIKGGTPKLRMLHKNHIMQNIDLIMQYPFNIIMLRELLLSYIIFIRKNIKGEIKPCATIIKRDPFNPQQVNLIIPQNIILM